MLDNREKHINRKNKKKEKKKKNLINTNDKRTPVIETVI